MRFFKTNNGRLINLDNVFQVQRGEGQGWGSVTSRDGTSVGISPEDFEAIEAILTERDCIRSGEPLRFPDNIET